MHRPAQGDAPKIWSEGLDEGDEEEPSWPRKFSFLQDLFSEAEVVGQGGFAVVYRARRIKDDLVVALKVAHSRFARAQDAMAREVEVLQAIGGRGAPRWLESSIGVKDQADFVVLEFVGGVSLAHRLAHFGRILLPDTLHAIVSGIFDAVERVHECGFVHNDLKPENILLDPQNRILLCDFDLARRQGEPVGDIDLDGGRGTAEYLSPERISGRDKADVRSDIYALGAILYELFAGHPPFWGAEVVVRDAHRSARVPSLKKRLLGELGESRESRDAAKLHAIHELVHRCLRKDPSRRPGSIAELRGLWLDALGQKEQRPPRELDIGVDFGELAKSAREHKSLQVASVGVLWIYSLCDRAELLLRIRDVGGVLVNCDRDRYVVVCGFKGLVNPVRASLEAAGRLMSTPDLRMQVVVDVASVFVAYEGNETPVFLSALWQRRDRYADSEDGRGLYIRNTAHELIPELSVSSLEHQRYSRWSMRSLEQVVEGVAKTGDLVGQDAVLSQLHRAAAHAYEGRAGLHWVFGNSGRGKSFVSAALAEELQDAFPYEKHVYWRVGKSMSGDPRSAFWDLWRHLFGATFKQARVGTGQSRFLRQVQRRQILDFAGPQGQDASMDAQHAQAREISSFLLKGYAEQRVLVLVIDDAHLLHECVLDAIRGLRDCADTRSLCVLFAHEPQDRSAWVREDTEEQHTLKALDETQSATMARNLLRHVASVPQRLLDWVAQRSAGNPMMIAGLVRALGRQGVTYPNPSTHRWEVDCEKLSSLPESPAGDWLLEREILSWPPGLLSLAQWAAVLPDGFRRHHLEDLVDELELDEDTSLPSLDPDYGLHRLREAEILYLDGARGYHFCHSQIRMTLLKRLGGESLVQMVVNRIPLQEAS